MKRRLFNMEETLQDLEKRLKDIEETAKKDEIEKKFAETLKEYKGDDEVILFQNVTALPDLTSYSSGFEPLDRSLRGFHEGDLIVVTAPTGQGKTTLLQTFTVNLHKKGIKSIWFTYEIPIQNLLQKFSEMPDGCVPKMLKEKSLVWIERKIVEAIVKFGIKVVFIDPFNSLSKFSTNNLSQELGDMAEGLKEIALKYNVVIFTSAHTKKIEADDYMSVNSIRDTALLGNKADTVIAMWRVKEKQRKKDLQSNGEIYTNETMISLVKNRYTGQLGSFKVSYSNKQFALLDLEHQSYEEGEIDVNSIEI